MRLLWIATKSPWPPVDGGRLLLAETLAALAGAGAKVTLVAPVVRSARREAEAALSAWCRPLLVEAAPRSRAAALARALATGGASSVTRHASRAVARAVAREIAARKPDVVVAEQLQAFAQTTPARRAGVPTILRAQNVESDLYRQAAHAARGARRVVLAREARALARAEGRALAAATATVTLSSADALALAALRPARIEAIAPPFPPELAPAAAPLAGHPALVLFGSAGWLPNERAERRFLAEVWPAVRNALPDARLHHFGAAERRGGGAVDERVVRHVAPSDSREAFAPGALLVLPVDLASGVRMRILEAWARGVAVLATPAAASGLRFTPGEELLLAPDAAEAVAEIRRFADEPELGARLVAAGRARLATEHAPERFAAAFLALAREAARTSPARRGGA